jgi:HSP20 family molecular chaperone IbpA
VKRLFEGSGRSGQVWVPTLEAGEIESWLVCAFDLPDLSQDEISVEVEGCSRTISASRSAGDTNLRGALLPA